MPRPNKTILPTLALCVAALALLETPDLYAKGRFVALPPVVGRAGDAKLQVRFVRYTGGSTGKMVVDVRNAGKRRATFDARGLFFVPDGDPESAPQRLGAAGPFQDGQGQRHESLRLRPGQIARLQLQVFCLDSHRSSPGAEQGFSVARERLPKNLRRKIDAGARRLNKAAAAPEAANSAIQSHVWKTRNKRWIKLQGERKNEHSRKGQRRHRQRLRNQMPIQNQLAE